MRLIGLLSWYEERPSWLAACITSYAQAGITHLIAIDGAYALYPQGRARSTVPEHETLVETTQALGLHLTLVLPDRTWHGNEVEKRNALFAYAEAIAQPHEDWLLVIDADELVTRALTGWTNELARTDRHAADVTLWERDIRDTQPKAQIDRITTIDPATQGPIRKLFRASPGIRCVGNHYTYIDAAGNKLWGNVGHTLTPGLDLTDQLHIEHRSIYRSQHRRGQAQDYYRRRDLTGIETPTPVL